jgi:hypothetical protein
MSVIQSNNERVISLTEIFMRYLAGDHNLNGDIQSNASTSMPIAQMALESMTVPDNEELTRKRRREDMELEMMSNDLRKQYIELKRKRDNLEQSKIKIKMRHDQYRFFIENLNYLDPNWRNDSKLVATAKAMLLRECLFELDPDTYTEKQIAEAPAKVPASSAKESLAVPSPAMAVPSSTQITASSAEDSFAVPSPVIVPTSSAKESPAPTAPVAKECIGMFDRTQFPRLSIQICATELGLGTLDYDDRCTVGERAMELYQSVKRKWSPKRFQCVCDGCSVAGYHETEWEIIVQALRDTLLSV